MSYTLPIRLPLPKPSRVFHVGENMSLDILLVCATCVKVQLWTMPEPDSQDIACSSHEQTAEGIQVARCRLLNTYSFFFLKGCHVHTGYSYQDNLMCKDAKKGLYFQKRRVFKIDSHFGQSK